MALTDKLKAIGDAIREKTGKTDLIPLSDMPNEILGISSGGKEENVIHIPYATRIDNTWGGAWFPENTELVVKCTKAPAVFTYAFNNARYYKSVTFISEDKSNVINFSSSLNLADTNTATLEFVDFTNFNKKFSNLGNAFRNQAKLKSIYGVMDLSECTATTQAFYYCTALEDIEFAENTIPISISFQQSKNLTKESITSAINGLDNTATGQTVSFSKTAVNNAFGIDVDDIATYTDEFNTLINSKNNWKISFQ